MKIHNFSRVLGFPFAICFAIILYLSIQNHDYDLSYWMIPPFVMVAIIFIMAPQIDFWWNKRNPPGVEQPVRDWLLTHSPFYQKLDSAGKKKFEDRLSIYLLGKEFITMAKQKQDGMPEDIKAVIAHNAIVITFYHEDFMMGDFDRIVVYQHPFPTPHNQFLHTVETEREDGVMLFALDYLLHGTINTKQYYNIGMHGHVEAFMKNNPTLPWDNLTETTWEHLLAICGFTREQIVSVIGFKNQDIIPVILTCYFTYPDRFRKVSPHDAGRLDGIFKSFSAVSFA